MSTCNRITARVQLELAHALFVGVFVAWLAWDELTNAPANFRADVDRVRWLAGV